MDNKGLQQIADIGDNEPLTQEAIESFRKMSRTALAQAIRDIRKERVMAEGDLKEMVAAAKMEIEKVLATPKITKKDIKSIVGEPNEPPVASPFPLLNGKNSTNITGNRTVTKAPTTIGNKQPDPNDQEKLMGNKSVVQLLKQIAKNTAQNKQGGQGNGTNQQGTGNNNGVTTKTWKTGVKDFINNSIDTAAVAGTPAGLAVGTVRGAYRLGRDYLKYHKEKKEFDANFVGPAKPSFLTKVNQSIKSGVESSIERRVRKDKEKQGDYEYNEKTKRWHDRSSTGMNRFTKEDNVVAGAKAKFNQSTVGKLLSFNKLNANNQVADNGSNAVNPAGTEGSGLGDLLSGLLGGGMLGGGAKGVLGKIGVSGLARAGAVGALGAVAADSISDAYHSYKTGESNKYADFANKVTGGGDNESIGSRLYDTVDTMKGWFGASDADKRKASDDKLRNNPEYQKRLAQITENARKKKESATVEPTPAVVEPASTTPESVPEVVEHTPTETPPSSTTVKPFGSTGLMTSAGYSKIKDGEAEKYLEATEDRPTELAGASKDERPTELASTAKPFGSSGLMTGFSDPNKTPYKEDDAGKHFGANAPTQEPSTSATVKPFGSTGLMTGFSDPNKTPYKEGDAGKHFGAEEKPAESSVKPFGSAGISTGFTDPSKSPYKEGDATKHFAADVSPSSPTVDKKVNELEAAQAVNNNIKDKIEEKQTQPVVNNTNGGGTTNNVSAGGGDSSANNNVRNEESSFRRYVDSRVSYN